MVSNEISFPCWPFVFNLTLPFLRPFSNKFKHVDFILFFTFVHPVFALSRFRFLLQRYYGAKKLT
jgi:hypothetical protein